MFVQSVQWSLAVCLCVSVGGIKVCQVYVWQIYLSSVNRTHTHTHVDKHTKTSLQTHFYSAELTRRKSRAWEHMELFHKHTKLIPQTAFK